MTEQQTLVKFLEKRLQDDEEAAERMAAVYPEPWDLYDRGWMVRVEANEPGWLDVVRLEQKQAPEGLDWLAGAIEHVAMHSPSRVLREVAAKRAIIADIVPAMNGADEQINSEWGVGPMDPADYESVALLRLLAMPYSDHEAYRPEWAPQIGHAV